MVGDPVSNRGIIILIVILVALFIYMAADSHTALDPSY